MSINTMPNTETNPNDASLSPSEDLMQLDKQVVQQNVTHHQFITFTVNNEEYGIDIMSVLEIKGWTETTRLPNQPEYLLGVLNLRGVIVPIMDLRYRFGGGKTQASSTNVIIIVSMQDRYIGILVDAVSDILTVSQNDIQDVPRIEGSRREHFLSGLVTIQGRMVAILELNSLSEATEDLAEFSQTLE